MAYEEINSGKLFASLFFFDKNEIKELVKEIETKEESDEIEISNGNKKKKYIQPPVVSHPSQPPTVIHEEINNGKLVASLHEFLDEKELLEYLEEIKKENENNELVIEKEINDEERKKKDKKNKNKNNDSSKGEIIIVAKNKKYFQHPVVSHPSQLPTMAYEEIDSGKLFTSPYGLKNEELVQKEEKQAEVETESKKLIKNKDKDTKKRQYIQPPVVSHDSQ